MPKIYAYDGMSFLNLRFENDVKKYGIQTRKFVSATDTRFENDVKKYGIQTIDWSSGGGFCLRMM